MFKKSKIAKTSASKHSAIPPEVATMTAGKETAAKTPVSAPAVVSMRASGPRIDIQPMLGNLRSVDCSVRAAAATALGRCGEAAVVAALVAALRDSDADVAREAATSLGLLL